MADTAQKSFEIRSARDYLNELLAPAVEEHISDSLSSRKAIGCMIFAWHLNDWVWAQHKATLQAKLGVAEYQNYRDFLFSHCPELEIIKELANGSKHFRNDNTTVTGTELAHGFASGLALTITQSHLVVKSGDDVYFAETLLDKVLQFWGDFFEKYIPPP